MAATFFETLNARWDAGARVCIGLDPIVGKMPPNLQMGEYKLPFCREIVNATADLALAFKLNLAFWAGLAYPQLREMIEHIKYIAPDVPVILDAKRGDVYDTNVAYADEAFDYFGADALTVNPYVGSDALQSFFDRADKGIFILCKTSNPGAKEVQDSMVQLPYSGEHIPLWKWVARRASHYWDTNKNVGFVVGATHPEEIKQVREFAGDRWLLVPGVGTQGGNLRKAVPNGVNRHGRGVIINSSSGIIHASSEYTQYSQAARDKVLRLTQEINFALLLWSELGLRSD